MITIISAMDRNGLIGNGNKLPWNYPEDMKFFKEQTVGSVCVMGRKTYQSIPNGLPKRINYILSKDDYLPMPYGVIYSEIEYILARIKFYNDIHKLDTFIIGGAQIYKLFLEYADRILITHIDREFNGDTYFPLTIKELEENYTSKIIKISGDLIFKEYLKRNDSNEI